MSEETIVRIGYTGERYVLLNKQGQQVHTLVAGDVIEVQKADAWCLVRVESGGYKGWYYVTSDGCRARFAVCMQVRMVEQQQVAPCVTKLSPLEQLRLAWVGQSVQSRVPLAVGYVSGVVREITEHGQALFVYTPHSNGVAVIASLPVARLDDLLTLVAS